MLQEFLLVFHERKFLHGDLDMTRKLKEHELILKRQLNDGFPKCKINLLDV